jgi:radical SAM superfamily enzyme
MATGRPRHLVVLRPSIDEVKNRDRKRSIETGKVAYRPDRFTPEHLDALLESTPRIGLWLDTSKQTPTESVDEILRRTAEAVANI